MDNLFVGINRHGITIDVLSLGKPSAFTVLEVPQASLEILVKTLIVTELLKRLALLTLIATNSIHDCDP